MHPTAITAEHELSRSCPYLDTINRSVLDFDFEKLCSISLSTNNVYACLVCGKYFQGTSLHPSRDGVCVNLLAALCVLGRGRNSHAYTHSVQVDHRVWLNLATLKFYCLPDNYQIIDPSLEDIKVVSCDSHVVSIVCHVISFCQFVLKPVFLKEAVAMLDHTPKMSIAFDGTKYLPGIVGLNNIKVCQHSGLVC